MSQIRATGIPSEKYGGIHGFKNGAPAYPSSDWADVDLFLHTWGFLPNDDSTLELLSKEQLIELCMLALYAASRIDLTGDCIKLVQEKMHKFCISPERKS